MRLSPTTAELDLRREVREFLDRALPSLGQSPPDHAGKIRMLREWQHRMHAAKLVGLSWPVEYGGRGLGTSEEIVVAAELAAGGAPETLNAIGIDVVGPSIIAHGTPEQKAAHLERILSAEDLWCQGFSESEAGSDLASLRTRAVLDGDQFVIDGQKVWTSYAPYAQWCAVLARTTPDVPAHQGISYLLVPMDAPGIEVRPLVHATGDPEFSEVRFTGVRVPRTALLGELHGGWAIAMHTLIHERGRYGLTRHALLKTRFDALVRETALDPRRAADDAVRRSLARAYACLQALAHHGARAEAEPGGVGPASSVGKLVLAEAEQVFAQAALEILGPDVVLRDGADQGVDTRAWQHLYFYGRSASVYGGTAQIQRSIIAQRILGLPREP